MVDTLLIYLLKNWDISNKKTSDFSEVFLFLFDMFSNNIYLTKYYRIYRDDDIVVINGVWTTYHIAKWITEFKSHINIIASNAHLIFMAFVWTNSPYDCNLGKITVIWGNKFLYLDMEFY